MTHVRAAAAAMAFALTASFMIALPAATGAATAARPASHKMVYPTVGAAMQRRGLHTAATAAAANLAYGGAVDGIGVTTGPPKVYLIFWGSQWGTASPAGSLNLSGDPSGMAPRVQALFQGLGTNNELWSGVMTQFCEGVAAGATTCPASAAHVGYPSGGAYAGVWVDTSAAAPASATGHQIGVEAVAAASHFGNTTAAANRNAQYVVVSPHGTTPDGFNTASGNFCAWHDWNGDTTLTGGGVSSSVGDVAFTNLPYITDAGSSCGANYVNAGSAGALDGVTMVEGHEYAETITDQNPAGGWTDSSGQENADKCAWNGTGGTTGSQNVTFANGSFAMQATWSNDAGACQISHAIVGAPTNDFSISASPASGTVLAGNGATSTIATALTKGASQTVSLAVSGATTGITATLSPTSVTTGGSSTLTITTTSAAAAGAHTLTVTGTAPSGAHTATYTLTVTVPDFSISASPTSGTVNSGSSVNVTVSTATLAGSAQTVALSASGLPSGVTAAFAPTSVTSGSSSTLTLTAAASAPTASATVTITGTGSKTHTASYALTVNNPTASGVVNGGFETGSFSGWTTAGTTSILSTGAHSGTYAGQAGSTAATNGDSNIVQTFTVPAGQTALSFWYSMTCPDTVTYDWATATLKDNTAATTATPLAKTCATATWKQVSATVIAGHNYTLTLTSHDDNYAGDASYTKFDDVALATPPPPVTNPVLNPGFETGTLASWTTVGTAAAVTGGHSGTYAGESGSSSPTNGDSNIVQTFTTPAGSSSLSFWYSMTCPDTVTYDWATATLKDNTAGTTVTVLAKTCATNAFTKVSAAVVAGHSYTLTLTSHDDNYAGDASFTKWDDVLVS